MESLNKKRKRQKIKGWIKICQANGNNKSSKGYDSVIRD